MLILCVIIQSHRAFHVLNLSYYGAIKATDFLSILVDKFSFIVFIGSVYSNNGEKAVITKSVLVPVRMSWFTNTSYQISDRKYCSLITLINTSCVNVKNSLDINFHQKKKNTKRLQKSRLEERKSQKRLQKSRLLFLDTQC